MIEFLASLVGAAIALAFAALILYATGFALASGACAATPVC